MNKSFYFILLFFLALASYSYGQKTDTVNFYNGDRAVCEIKSLAQGKLEIKTVAMGTIVVEWRNVNSVISSKLFEIVLSDHTTFFGSIAGIDSSRNAIIRFGIFEEAVNLSDIVKLSPISSNFWKEVDGSLSFGFNFTKGTSNLQLNSAGIINFRTKRTVHTVSFNSNLSANPTSSSEKQDAGYRFQYYYKNRVYNALDIGWEQNSELGVLTRVISTISVGYNVINNSNSLFSVEAGGSANREFTTEDSALYNTEGLLRLKYDLFIFHEPKLFVTLDTEIFPSFTIADRLRSNFELKVTWDIFKDFTFSINYWANLDTKPIDVNALSFDWGTTTSFGYKF